MLYQTTRSILITVEPKLVIDTLLCPKFIVLDFCSHIIQCPGKTVAWVLIFSLFGGFTGLEGNIGCQILGGGGGGAAPTPLQCSIQVCFLEDTGLRLLFGTVSLSPSFYGENGGRCADSPNLIAISHNCLHISLIFR